MRAPITAVLANAGASPSAAAASSSSESTGLRRAGLVGLRRAGVVASESLASAPPAFESISATRSTLFVSAPSLDTYRVH